MALTSHLWTFLHFEGMLAARPSLKALGNCTVQIESHIQLEHKKCQTFRWNRCQTPWFLSRNKNEFASRTKKSSAKFSVPKSFFRKEMDYIPRDYILPQLIHAHDHTACSQTRASTFHTDPSWLDPTIQHQDAQIITQAHFPFISLVLLDTGTKHLLWIKNALQYQFIAHAICV